MKKETKHTPEDQKAAMELTLQNFNTSDLETNPYYRGVLDGILHERPELSEMKKEREELVKLMKKMLIAMDDIGFAGVPASRLDAADTLVEKAKELLSRIKK